MKKTITVALILISTIGYSQKKDSITYLPDSVNTISLTDMQKVLDSMGDKISKNEWSIWLKAYQELALATQQKRIKSVIKAKN